MDNACRRRRAPARPRERRWLRAALAAVFLAVAGNAPAAPTSNPSSLSTQTWAERDTRLANEYLSLLVSQPEYGRVIDLLWNLYEKHNATGLLLENVSTQAQTTRHPSVLLVQGHLIRKNGDLRNAAAIYDAVLKAEPKNLHALRARADVARDLADPATAFALLKTWTDLIPDADPKKPQAWIELGTLALAADKNKDAAAAWETAAKLRPKDFELARQVAQLLLRAGFPDRAAAFFGALARQSEPQRRLEALLDLARIHEHADQFPQADAALKEGMALLDFRDGRYADFFRRRVRLHERFGALEELRKQLIKTAGTRPPQEQAVRDLVRFFESTVEPDEQLRWQRELVKVAPGIDDYRWELVRSLLDHEGAGEAAQLLDERLKNDGSDLPAAVFLRCEADLRTGDPASAAARLKKLLDAQGGSIEIEKQALAFAQQRALDAVIEMILHNRLQRNPSKAEAVFELASFYRGRRDTTAVDAVLKAFTDSAPNEVERQRRLNDAASFLAAGNDLDSAIMLAREALAKPAAGRDEHLRLADLLAEQGDAEEAAALLEQAWSSSRSDDERLDVDERLFSVLMGGKKADVSTNRGTAGDFQLPDAFTGKGFANDDPATGMRDRLPEAVTQRARVLVDAALQALAAPVGKGRQPANEQQVFRAAWWAMRSEMWDHAYDLLRQLELDPVTGRSRELPIEAEKLRLDLALTDGNKSLAERSLRSLMRRDPANRIRYVLRLSELMMESEQAAAAAVGQNRWRMEGVPAVAVSEATRLLEQAYREMPDSEQLLSALSQCYMLQRRADEAAKLWQAAVQRATGSAAIPLMERYADMLLAQQKLPQYVATQLDIIERETDVKRRRDAFKRCLERLMTAEGGVVLAPSVVQERLRLLEKALTEETRRHPFDGFYHEALALIHERGGDTTKGFAEMKLAYYTAPETPFTLDQLRDAALRIADLTSAIYFQKKIAAAAPPKELAAESRRLVEMLEQTFQIAEADRVRRRLESRFSQDAAALEDLAEHYKSTGQDEAERRVYEQIAKVRPWDARSLLRIALKCLRLADHPAAIQYLREILAQTEADAFHAKVSSPARLPLPLADERKTSSPGPVTEISSLLDTAPGLERAELNRLRAFLNLPRAEFTQLPDQTSYVRLRAIEELAKLLREKEGAPLQEWIAHWSASEKAPPVERLWALHYAGEGAIMRQQVRSLLGRTPGLEADFCFLWLTLRSHGMAEALQWAGQTGMSLELLEPRKRLLLALVSMLADLDTFRYAPGELAALGAARLLRNAPVLEITRKLQDQQRYEEALELGESLRKISPAVATEYAVILSRVAESAERWPLARHYLTQVVRAPVRPGSYRGQYDPYLFCLGAVNRLAASEQEREEALHSAWQQLQKTPDSAMTRIRKSAVAGLAGAEQRSAAEMETFLTRDFVSSRTMGEMRGMLMPQGSSRYEEPMHLRSLWEETREIQATFVQQGLGGVVQNVNEAVAGRWGNITLSSRTGMEFGEWRLGHLLRELRDATYPQRQQMIREHLGSVDMRMEVSVETLGDLGGRLESAGMSREAIDVYKLLPGRAPANPDYAQWLLRACESAQEIHMGLQFSLQLLMAEPPYKPPTPGDEVLREKHARFLALNFDIEELRRRAFLPAMTKVMQGRIPYEVPYLRELALLHERLGQDGPALEAWEHIHAVFISNAERGVEPDAESNLHRGRLLHKTGKTKEALEALRSVPLTEPSGVLGREALILRAELAAAGGNWEEFRELMATAAERRSLVAVARLAALLQQNKRSTEALNFLTQAERTLKEDGDRFRLRLELLRLLATETSWSPARGANQVAALFRVSSQDPEALKMMIAWLGEQARGPNAEGWVKVLRTEARAGAARPTAALALCAFAKALPESAADDLLHGWKAAKQEDRVCIDLAANTLLAAGRAKWAWQACMALQDIATLRLDGRKQPLMVRVAHAQGERHRVQELFAEVIRMPFPGGQQPVEWAHAFEQAEQPKLARELYLAALDKLDATNGLQPELWAAWTRFLIQQQEFEAAEAFLMKKNWAMVAESAKLIFELYRAWGRLDTITAELTKFHLPGGIAQEVLFLTRQAAGLPPPPPLQF